MSNQRPSLLPEKPPIPAITPAEQFKRQKRQRRYLLMTIAILVTLLIGILLGIFIQPELFGLVSIPDLEATDQRHSLTGEAQFATQQALVTANAQLLNQQQNLQSTQVELNNRQFLLQATETQAAINSAITQTAIAVDSAQEATQAALDFQQTQQAIQQQATRIQEEFEATQTAINSRLPTAIPTIPPNVAFIDGGIFNTSESLPSNNLPLSQAWSSGQDGALIAQQNNATLLTQQTDFGNRYTINVQLVPITTSTFYDVVLGVSQDSGYGFRVFYDGQQITTVGLYHVNLSQIASGIVIAPENTIASIANINQPAQQVSISIQVDGATITATANDTVLSHDAGVSPIRGHVGLQAPMGTALQRFTVSGG